MAEQPVELSQRKLEIEVEKLREEIGKIREDRRWWNRHLAVLGALCGVAATFLVGFSQFQDSSKRNELDIRRADRDERRREVDNGLRLAQFVLDQRDDWLMTADPEAQARFVRIVTALLPPEEASRLLAAVSTVATQAATVSALSTAAASLPAEQAQRVQQSLTAPPSTAPPPAPTPTPGPTPAPGPAPAARPDLPALIVFGHAPDAVDRGAAQRIVAALPQALRAATVERVGDRGPRGTGEVRIYSPEQRTTAERIIEALGPLTERELGRTVPFRIVDISGNYRNLPTDRLEIWFPR